MSNQETVIHQPEIAIFQSTDTGEEPTGPVDNTVRFNGWRVIKHGSIDMGKWTSGNEAMQQLLESGRWYGDGYRDGPGNLTLFTVGEGTTEWHMEQIIKVHRNGYRVGVILPADPKVRARMRRLHDVGIATMDYDPRETDMTSLESRVVELAYS